jgi:L-iditol 2-dehydrogenase
LKAVVFDGSLSLKEVPRPGRVGEALVRVERAGICGTDTAIALGKYKVRGPLVLGHEIVGTVAEAPEGRGKDLLGRRVVTEINVACGHCYFCGKRMNTHCANVQTLGISRDGGFAEFVSTPVDNLHEIPDDVSDEQAVFVEPLAAAIELTKMGPVNPESSCLVLGTGRLGLLIVQVLGLTGPSLLVAIGRPGKKLMLAKDYGADHALPMGREEDALALTGGHGFENVVEVTGASEGIGKALELVAPRGTVHVKSTHGLPAEVDLTRAVVREVRIQGSRCGPFPEAIDLLRSHKVRVDEMVTHRFGLDSYEDAFEAAVSRAAVKALFEI